MVVSNHLTGLWTGLMEWIVEWQNIELTLVCSYRTSDSRMSKKGTYSSQLERVFCVERPGNRLVTVESMGLPTRSMDEDHTLTFNRLSHAARHYAKPWLKNIPR